MPSSYFDSALARLKNIQEIKISGRITALKGLLLECEGLHPYVSLGSRCVVITNRGEVPVEVVGFRGKTSMLMPFKDIGGVGIGAQVLLHQSDAFVHPHTSWKGRVLNAFAEPIDGKGLLTHGEHEYSLKSTPPPAHKRKQVKGKLNLGVRAMNAFLTCCRGQRMGIFAGSGVGKSMLIAMLTRFCEADIKVIGLIGERGREVYEFIHEYLGEEGLKHAVVVVATSDESALMRRQAAYLTLSIAEYFRDQGQQVLCLMDSVTRFAMAQREIGLSAGEPPTAKGYTPTVFVELPKLLERAGPGIEDGNITGLFSVLVEGDDHNEPISDAVRGILDGHIVLDRSIAERGRFPAINILRSVSRTLPNCNSPEENRLVERGRRLMATYNDMAEMIRLGAYRKGSDPEVDEAILYHAPLEAFLAQKPEESESLSDSYLKLEQALKKK